MNKFKGMKIAVLMLCVSALIMTGCALQNRFSQGDGAGGQTQEAKSTEDSASASTYSMEPAAEGVYRVGILRDADTASLNLAVDGYKQELITQLGTNVEFDEMQKGERVKSAAKRLVGDGCCLILAAGEDSVEEAAAATESIPVVGVGVSDYVVTGTVSSNDSPDGNVTGVSSLVASSELADLIVKVDPEVKCTAILYDNTRKNSRYQVLVLEKYLREKGIQWKEYTGSDKVSIETAASRAAADNDCSVIFLPFDVTIAENADTITELALNAKKPMVTSDIELCRKGALAVYGADYYGIGQRAAAISYEIAVTGASPSKTPVYYLQSGSCEAYYNAKTAYELGWSAPAGIKMLTGTEPEGAAFNATESAAAEITSESAEEAATSSTASAAKEEETKR